MIIIIPEAKPSFKLCRADRPINKTRGAYIQLANIIIMDTPRNKEAQCPTDSVDSRLEEILQATIPPPARLPERHPSHIPATTSDSNATASLVLGIISLCLPVISFPTALLGLTLGLIANAHAKSTARVGITLNAIALGISIVGGIILLILGVGLNHN